MSAQHTALLICVVVCAVVALVAVLTAPGDYRLGLSLGVVIASAALCAAVTAAVHYREKAEQFRRFAAADANAAGAQIAAANDAAGRAAWELKGSESRRSAALTAFAGAAGRMQAITTSMLAELREMEHRHGDAAVLADLLQLDHRTAQAGRLADSIAVLSGARSGRRWAKPIAMESIMRGAMGRIAGYQRVRLRAVADVAIAGHAAEGVMHALAELLDNACNFSPPTTEVHVYAAEVPAGAVITIEDSGLVMSPSALRRAERAVSVPAGGASGDLSTLTGTRLGLAVVGHLARKHGLTVSFRASAIGGTAVVVMVPRELTTRVERRESTLTGVAPVATEVLQREEPPARDEDAKDSALPRRRRGSALAAAHPGGLTTLRPDPPQTPRPASPPAALGAFQRAWGTTKSADATSSDENSATTDPTATAAVENES